MHLLNPTLIMVYINVGDQTTKYLCILPMVPHLKAVLGRRNM